jgi:hypothetical protein
MKTAKAFPIILVTGICIFGGCGGKRVLPSVFRNTPKISRANYIGLEKAYDIDVTHINMFNKENLFDRFIDFDERNNMYIADSYQSKIFVFDDRGTLLRSFGAPGQGPRDFDRISRILVDGAVLRVFEGGTDVKNVTLSGEYVSKTLINIENKLLMKKVGQDYLVLRGRVDSTFTKLDLIVSSLDKDFSLIKDLFVYPYPPGFRGPSYDFRYSDWILILDDGEFYFPENILNKYSIIHYQSDGQPIKAFGRKYSIMGYSKDAESRFNYLSRRLPDKKEIPRNPPVVNRMFRDERGNIWVLVGETYEDNRNPGFDNTVDVFDSRGEWVYSLKTKSFSRYSLYHKGRIYRAQPPDDGSLKQYLEVFEIRYLN